MKIGRYLQEGRILLDLKAGGKKEAVGELAALLGDASEISDMDLFLEDVFQREKLCTTGVGDEVALPHARTNAVKKFIIALGRSKKGVEFASLDGKPVKLIFLMGTPKEERLGVYLKVLAHLSRLLRSREFRRALLKAASAKKIIDEFKKAEG